MLRVAVISVHTCPLARLGARETGGMNVYVRELSRHLGAKGAAIDVFTRRQDEGTPEVVQFGENARVIHLPAGPVAPVDKYDVIGHLPEFARRVSAFQAQAERRYDLVHAHYWLSSPVAIALALRWQVPLVTMFHTLGRMKNRVTEDGVERESRVRMEIEQAAVHASELLVAGSPTDMEHIVRHYGTLPSRVRIVPGGVDTNRFQPVPRQVAREMLGMGSERQLLFVGRLQRLKGVDLLIRAFATLLASWVNGPKPRLTIVGGGRFEAEPDPDAREEERLRALARELSVDNNVVFEGAVSHDALPLYYSAADVVAVPSLYETFGLVALEAMACGTPVVASRVGGLQWTVRDGETGRLVSATSTGEFSSAIGELLRDESLRARMSRNAIRQARGFSWEASAERTLELYGELVPVVSQRMVSSAR